MRFITPFIYLLAGSALIATGAVLWFGVSFRQFDEVVAGGVIGKCTPVIGIAGAADMEQIPGTDVVFMTSMDRRGGASRGAILRFDLSDPLDSGSWRDRTGGDPILFDPMGIDLYHAPLPDGRWLTRLFVVNAAGPEVLLFDVDAAGNLALRERFTDPRLTSPSDVVATGPRSFYATNDARSGRKSWKGRLDFIMGLKTGQLLEFDGSSWSDVADGLSFPNGMALSNDGKTLYVAETRARAVVRFDRDPQSDVLTRIGSIPLATFPGNVSIDEDGHLLVGTMPQPLAYSAYDSGAGDLAPSYVVRVTQSGIVETLFSDPGDRLSAATMGVPVGDMILIGSRAADRFLMCNEQ